MVKSVGNSKNLQLLVGKKFCFPYYALFPKRVEIRGKHAGEKHGCSHKVGLSCLEERREKWEGMMKDERAKAHRRSALGEQTRRQGSPMPLAWVRGWGAGCFHSAVWGLGD